MVVKISAISIIDSEEVEYPSSSSSSSSGTTSTITPEQQKVIKTKIELHQKVFPMHEVVGWYRIDISRGGDGSDDHADGLDVLPTEADLMINNGWMKEYNESPLFVLMDANEKTAAPVEMKQNEKSYSNTNNSSNNKTNNGDEKDPKKKKNDNDQHMAAASATSKAYNSSRGEDAREKLDSDEQLPLTVYETMITGVGGRGETAVFVNLDFELETFEPERIAVEKVFETEPKRAIINMSSNTPNSSVGSAAVTTTTTTTDSSKISANPEDGIAASTSNTASQVQHQSAAEAQMSSLITSIEAMNTRIAVLLDFLHKTRSGEIPPNHALLRQVGSLINQLPLVLGRGVFSSDDNDDDDEEGKIENGVLANEYENEYDDMLIVSFLATIAKTTQSVLSYSARFKIMSESGGGGGGKDMGKGRYDRYKDVI